MLEQFNDLEQYILNENNMHSYLKYKLVNPSNKTKETKKDLRNSVNKEIQQTKSSIFFPKEQDSLFWCYYIIKNGDTNYELLNVKNTLLTKQLKFDLVDLIRQNKQVVKTYKFDTISNIECNLANDDNISIKTIMSLFAIDKINVIFVSKNTFFELMMNDDKDVYIIRELQVNNRYQGSIKKYGFEIANSDIIENIRSTLYKVETLDKPIKALSSYKVQDLIDIANKLAIEVVNKDTGKNKTKNDLYESIIMYF